MLSKKSPNFQYGTVNSTRRLLLVNSRLYCTLHLISTLDPLGKICWREMSTPADADAGDVADIVVLAHELSQVFAIRLVLCIHFRKPIASLLDLLLDLHDATLSLLVCDLLWKLELTQLPVQQVDRHVLLIDVEVEVQDFAVLLFHQAG